MLKKRVHIAPLVVVMLLVSRCTLADSVDDYLRQQVKEKHIPGAVLIELKDGKIIKQQSYGVANVELDVPMRDSNVFLVASITKVFVATAVFLLVQDGKLTVNDKITQVVPGLPEAWSDITLLNCLSHTSGIPDDRHRDRPILGMPVLRITSCSTRALFDHAASILILAQSNKLRMSLISRFQKHSLR